MQSIQQTKVTKAIRVVSGAIGLFAAVYMSWYLYAIYFMYPNDANYSLFGIVMVAMMVGVGAATVAYARLVWRRTLGVGDNRWKPRVLGAYMIVPSVLVSPLAPTMFVILAFVMMSLNAVPNRAALNTD